MTRWRILSRLLSTAVIGGATLWVAGLFWFVLTTHRPPPAPPNHTDGIVALTGGAGRVELALHLLATGRADRLLLSGIGGGTDLATLGRLAGIDTAPLADRITVGRYAASTWGNGIETAAWAEQNRITSLIVVTAAYHMPRALAELHQALPDVRLFPSPVGLGDAHTAAEKHVGLRLEAAEYTKYLLTASGLSAWLPRREPDAALGAAASAAASAGG
ncbi:MAG TPA: YdcF family protein [Rhodopila sp.]|jgi:uncharacterized SAM-binding protein YcdF (DUF218 family)|nr:YdcF family protein [Rhodopila sp.]